MLVTYEIHLNICLTSLVGEKANAPSEEKQSPANSPEVKDPVDQLYAQVDKKKKKKVQEGTKPWYILIL